MIRELECNAAATPLSQQELRDGGCSPPRTGGLATDRSRNTTAQTGGTGGGTGGLGRRDSVSPGTLGAMASGLGGRHVLFDSEWQMEGGVITIRGGGLRVWAKKSLAKTPSRKP